MLNKKGITVISAVFVAALIISLSYYELALIPTPVTVTNSTTEYNWNENFTWCYSNDPLFFHFSNATESSATIASNGHSNSSLSIAVCGDEWRSHEGPEDCFHFWIIVNGNLTPNLHLKQLVVTQTVEAYPAKMGGFFNITRGIDGRPVCLRYAPCGMSTYNLSLSPPGPRSASEVIIGTGSISTNYNFVNDSGLEHSSFFHFNLSSIKKGFSQFCSGVTFVSNLPFFPQSYNITYYIDFAASITGLSKPATTQVEVVLRYV